MKRNSLRGFTLLELLVAIAIFSIMAAMAYGGLNSLITGSQHTDLVAKRLGELQRTVLFLQQDISQIAARPVRDEFGELEPALRTGIEGSGGQILQLTRGGFAASWNHQSSMRRIFYHVKENQLIRGVWPVLDRVQGSEPRQIHLTDELEQIEFHFLTKNRPADWIGSWPEVATETAESELPRAIEVRLKISGVGEIVRVFVIGS